VGGAEAVPEALLEETAEEDAVLEAEGSAEGEEEGTGGRVPAAVFEPDGRAVEVAAADGAAEADAVALADAVDARPTARTEDSPVADSRKPDCDMVRGEVRFTKVGNCHSPTGGWEDTSTAAKKPLFTAEVSEYAERYAVLPVTSKMGGALSLAAVERNDSLPISNTEEAENSSERMYSRTVEVALPVARMVPTAVAAVVGLGHTIAS
jgi:hypothetical protein